MRFLETVCTQADQEVILMKKPAPFVIQKNTIGLEVVFNTGARFFVFILKLQGTSKKIEPHESRLSSLPGHGHLRNLMGFEKLPDIGLMNLIGHAKIASRIEPFLILMEAIVATKITGRP